MIALAALLLSVQAQAQEAPPWLQQAMEPFASACIDGRLPSGATEITRDELPRGLRNHHGRVEAGRYHRLVAGETYYLIQVTNPSRRAMSQRFRSVCAIAVPDRRRLITLFDAVNQLGPRAEAALGRNLYLSAVIADSWVVVAISHPTES